jgi:DNA-directed RNA polymerase subunit D
MKISPVELNKKENKAIFVLEGATPTMANTLRRLILEHVPTMAIEKVEFTKNNSAMYDEVSAHRLGLIPLTTDLKGYNLPWKCTCEGNGCPRCEAHLTLSMKGPGTVYASDLQSKDPKIKPVYPKMILAKLLKGQELEFDAIASLGTGKMHMKWSPGHVWYKYKPSVEIIDQEKAQLIKQTSSIPVLDVHQVRS